MSTATADILQWCFADKRIKGGWITVVTGVGSGANFEECGKVLTLLKEAGAVLAWEMQADNGAYHIQLAPLAQAGPHQPSPSSYDPEAAPAESRRSSTCPYDHLPHQTQPHQPAPLTHGFPQSLSPPGRVTVFQPAPLTSSDVFDMDAWLKENGWDFSAPSH